MLETLKIYFLPGMINTLIALYVILKISKCSFKLSFDSIIYIFLWIILSVVNHVYCFSPIKFFSSTLINILFATIILKSNINIIIVSSILEQFLLFFSEIIYFFILFLFFGNINVLINNTYIGTIIICLICVLLININFIQKIYDKILSFTFNVNKYFILLILVVTVNILLSSVYNGNNMYGNLFFMILYTYIVYMFLYEKNKNDIYEKENKNLIENLNEYEKMLDYQRVNNHENKNQLLVIKSMVEKKDENTIDYINEIIKDKREDNDILYTKAKRIPSGGLQGLIYQKMLLIQEKGINIVLDVSTKVRKIDLLNISPRMNYDICRIVGIILDNAIEETEKVNKKDKEILIYMYIDDYFNIEISNHFVGNIEIDKIFNKGYTTKGNGHGYGLELLRKIVASNDNITNEIKIVNDLFVQIVKIKM